MQEILKGWEGVAWSLGVLGGSLILGFAGHLIFFKVAGRLAKHTLTELDDSLVRHCRGPARGIIPLLMLFFLLPLAKLPQNAHSIFVQGMSWLLIFFIAWLIIRLTSVLEDLLMSQYRMDVADNLRARTIHTQIQILKKVVWVVVGILTLAIILMSIEKVRQLGTSILASAGIAGIIVGFAAQRSIATLLAGVQIAITQPIRLDDVVIVENEWGRVEEITLTYVVVRIWDLRRLIVPITYFLEKPFQNWTRVSAEILGTVFIYVDYTVPVQAVREELRRLLKGSELWDGGVCVLHVTNATDKTVEIRALMSAADSSNAWELRCHVREKLLEFVQKNYPNGLPKVRAEIPAVSCVRTHSDTGT
jgi:small-conductance mechanosensitive channel